MPAPPNEPYIQPSEKRPLPHQPPITLVPSKIQTIKAK